eukprot:g3856.t1
MDLLDRVSKRVEDFIRQNRAFILICEQCFIVADTNYDGRVSPEEVASQTSIIFEYLKNALKSSSIEIVVPSKTKVLEILQKADLNKDNYLDRQEFVIFYEQVLKLAAFNAARGFCMKNGTALMTAISSVVGIYIGKMRLSIPDRLKQSIQIATPFVSMAIGAFVKQQIANAQQYRAEKRLFRSEAIKKTT